MELVKAAGGDNVVHIDRVPPELVASAYHGASAHVLPSWAEGAALANLEAASAGYPIVVSDRSSEFEYFGDLALYLDPADPASIRRAVEDAVDARERDAEQIAELKRRMVDLTWEKTARARPCAPTWPRCDTRERAGAAAGNGKPAAAPTRRKATISPRLRQFTDARLDPPADPRLRPRGRRRDPRRRPRPGRRRGRSPVPRAVRARRVRDERLDPQRPPGRAGGRHRRARRRPARSMTSRSTHPPHRGPGAHRRPDGGAARDAPHPAAGRRPAHDDAVRVGAARAAVRLLPLHALGPRAVMREAGFAAVDIAPATTASARSGRCWSTSHRRDGLLSRRPRRRAASAIGDLRATGERIARYGHLDVRRAFPLGYQANGLKAPLPERRAANRLDGRAAS